MAAPLYASMVVVSMATVVNTAALGRFGTASLAALAVASAVLLPATAAISGAVRGLVPFVAEAAGKPDRVRVLARDGGWLAAGAGVVGAAAVLALPLLADAVRAPPETVEALGSFPLLAALALLVNAVGALGASLLVGLGRTGVLVPAGTAGAVSTAALSWVLVLGVGPLPALGLTGSGCALLVSQLVTTVVTLGGVARRTGVRARDLLGSLRLREVLLLARVGLPLAGTVLAKFAGLGVVALAAARVGTVQAAAHGVLVAVVGLVFTAAVAVGQAQVAVVAAHAGSGSRSRVRRGVVAGLVLTLSTVGLLCVVLLAARSTVPGAFTDDPEMAHLVTALLPLLVVSLLADAAQSAFGFGLAGLKRTVPSLLVLAVTYAVLAVVVLALTAPAAPRVDLVGIWWCVVAANVVLLVGQAVAFARVSAGVGRGLSGR